MNRISDVFKNKKALVAFITGGDPDIDTTEKLIIEMAKSGVDVIEIGIPFSDPVAEGPVIQKADERALAAGCTVDKLFEMIKRVRTQVDVPLLFMTYINPIFAYGTDRFFSNCADCGIDGVIVPDLPFEEKGEISDACAKFDVTQISMIAPTSDERVKLIAGEAEGFLYCVSSLGVTGTRSQINTNIGDLIAEVKKVKDIPCAIGFGISTPEQAKDMAALGDGVIIGSAIVNLVAEHGRDSVSVVGEFVKGVRRKLDE